MDLPNCFKSYKRTGVGYILTILKQRPILFLSTIGARTVWELSPLARPAIVGFLVDRLGSLQASSGRVASDTQALAALGALLGFGLIRSAAAWAYGESSARLGLHTVSYVRFELLKLINGPNSPTLSTGDLLTRTLRDTDRLRGFIDRVFIRSLTSTLRAILPVIMLFLISPSLAVCALVILPIQQLITHGMQRRIQSATRATADAHAALTDRLQASLIHQTDITERNRNLLQLEIRTVEKTELRSKRLITLVRATIWLCTSIGVSLVWFLGSLSVDAGDLSIGALVSFAGYTTLVYRPFRQFAGIIQTYREGLVSLERIAEVADHRK